MTPIQPDRQPYEKENGRDHMRPFPRARRYTVEKEELCLIAPPVRSLIIQD